MDGTEQRKDTPQTGQSPETAKGTSEKVYTQADIQKAVNDALAKAGRDAKSFEQKELTIAERTAELEQRQKDLDEMEAAAKDPQLKSALAVRQKTRKEAEERDKERAARYEVIEKLAEQYNIKPSQLLKYRTPTEMELAAKLFAKEQEPAGKPPATEANLPDTGVSDAAYEDAKSIRAAFIKNPSDPTVAGKFVKLRREGKI